MDPNEFDHRYSKDDALELLGVQAFSVVVTAIAGVAVGAAWFEAVLSHGEPLSFPYGGLAAATVGAFAVYNAVSIPARYAFIWNAPKARRRITSCLLQVASAGTIIAIAAFVLAGFQISLADGQSVMNWLDYGALAAGVLQTLGGLGGLALLMTGRELPDIDG